MSVYPRILSPLAVLSVALLLGGCGMTQRVSTATTGLFGGDEEEAAQTEEKAAPAAEEAAPPMPEPAPEPEPAPTPEPEPAPVVEEALPLPPPAMLDEMAPEEAAPPAPAELETYEVMVPEGAYVFVPRQITIYAGDTVVWKNESGIVHLFASVPGADPSGAMEIEASDLDVGGSISHTFNTPGTYPYFCFIHNRMTGKVVVLPR